MAKQLHHNLLIPKRKRLQTTPVGVAAGFVLPNILKLAVVLRINVEEVCAAIARATTTLQTQNSQDRLRPSITSEIFIVNVL